MSDAGDLSGVLDCGWHSLGTWHLASSYQQVVIFIHSQSHLSSNVSRLSSGMTYLLSTLERGALASSI